MLRCVLALFVLGTSCLVSEGGEYQAELVFPLHDARCAEKSSILGGLRFDASMLICPNQVHIDSNQRQRETCLEHYLHVLVTCGSI